MKEKETIWTKLQDCPICKKRFEVENIWTNRVKFSAVHTDMAKKYEDINPLFYEIWVCPLCLYSAYRKESFEDVTGLDKSTFASMKEMRQKVGHGIDFHQPRNWESGMRSYKLALLTLQCKPKISASRYGFLFLKMAWLYRAKNMVEEEGKFLKIALSRFSDAYEKETNPDIGSMGETGLVYTIGELYRRTGDPKKAMEYYMKVITSKEMGGDPQFIRLSRDMLAFTKEGKSPEFIR